MIIWDEDKNSKLKLERDISFEEISDMILNHHYIDILENTSRPNQNIFIIPLKDYIYAVPFLIDDDSNIILKTAYPSRKFYQKYRGDLWQILS